MSKYIYTLTDPRDSTVRYVGLSNNPQRRFYQHMQCREKSNPAKIEWIQDLKRNHLKPILSIIEEIAEGVSPKQREDTWIDHYLNQNAPLLNRPNAIEEMWANMDFDTRIVDRDSETYVDVRRLKQ